MLAEGQDTEIIRFVLDTGEEFIITENQFQGWQRLVPDVNVRSELNRMKLWIENNPDKRKSKNSINRFITNWLSKEQKEAERFKAKAAIEDVPDWYADTTQTKADDELKDRIEKLQKKLK